MLRAGKSDPCNQLKKLWAGTQDSGPFFVFGQEIQSRVGAAQDPRTKTCNVGHPATDADTSNSATLQTWLMMLTGLEGAIYA